MSIKKQGESQREKDISVCPGVDMGFSRQTHLIFF